MPVNNGFEKIYINKTVNLSWLHKSRKGKIKMATWDESEHPRDEEGKFTYKNGGSSNSNPLLLGGIQYNEKKENREDILYNDNSFKDKLSNYRNKLLDFLGDNLEREEILYSNISELENKIFNNTLETIKTTRDKLANSVNKLRENDFNSKDDFKTLVNKAQKNYDALGELGQEANNMFKINLQKGKNGFGEDAIRSVLRYKKSLENESDEIITMAENIKNQKDQQVNEKPLSNLGELPVNQTINYKRAVEPPISQIKSNSQINNRYKTKVDPSEVVANWIMPCEGVITSPYGWRIHPIKKERSYHHGIDIANKLNTPIYAPIDGIITFADYEGANGNCIRINHGNINGKIVTSTFIHLNQINVKKEQRVKKGQLIGLMGSTGRYSNGKPSSTGPHLHLSVYENKVPVDPFKYIKK